MDTTDASMDIDSSSDYLETILKEDYSYDVVTTKTSYFTNVPTNYPTRTPSKNSILKSPTISAVLKSCQGCYDSKCGFPPYQNGTSLDFCTEENANFANFDPWCTLTKTNCDSCGGIFCGIDPLEVIIENQVEKCFFYPPPPQTENKLPQDGDHVFRFLKFSLQSLVTFW